MWPDLDDNALQLGDETVSYGELALLGAASGRLGPARAVTEESLRSSQDAEVARQELRAAAVSFRQERRLQSGEDLRAWLGERRLGVDEWEQYLRRLLSRGLAGERRRQLPPGDDDPAVAAALDSALAVDLACDGWWEETAGLMVRYWSAGRLEAAEAAGPAAGGPVTPVAGAIHHDDTSTAKMVAGELAFLGALDASWCAERLEVLSSRRRALELMERRYADDAVVAARLQDHAADWLRLVFEEIRLPSRPAGNEAVLCAREDGLTAEEIARRSGAALRRHDRRRQELVPDVAAALLGALPGEVLGPVGDGAGVAVLWLRERREVSPDDAEARADAAAELLAEALERVSAGQVREVGPL